MASPIVFGEQLLESVQGTGAGVRSLFLDLGFPCHLSCEACTRDYPDPRLYHAARRRLLAASSDLAAEKIRAVFFGGDAFALPRSFEALLEESRDSCARNSALFEALVLSDGTSWSSALVRRFAELGVRWYQVALDGPPSAHDSIRPTARGGPSFGMVMRSLKYHREGADVVVRVDAALGTEAVERLADVLEEEGLFAEPHPVTLFVAPRAAYATQCQDLLRLLHAMEHRGVTSEGAHRRCADRSVRSPGDSGHGALDET